MSHREADPYLVLGVGRTATQAELSRAYRRLLRRHHPDTRVGWDDDGGPGSGTRPDAEDALQRILAAYALVRDPDRRAAYDRRFAAREVSAPRNVSVPRRAAESSAPAGRQPPIQAGPVHWQPG